MRPSKHCGANIPTRRIANSSTAQLDLLYAFGIPASVLPEVLDSNAYYGETKKEWLGAAIPIAGVAGDQQAALIGQACFQPGMGAAGKFSRLRNRDRGRARCAVRRARPDHRVMLAHPQFFWSIKAGKGPEALKA
jgi:hypothetical protein